jgi:hypothetical protein
MTLGATLGAVLLKAWMDENQRSRDSVGRAIGVSKDSVHRWLNGERPHMTVRFARRIKKLTDGRVPIESWDEPATEAAGGPGGDPPPASGAAADLQASAAA